MMDISPSRTGLLAQTFLEASRFSCTLLPDVLGVFDYAEPDGRSRITRFASVAFPLSEKGRHSDC